MNEIKTNTQNVNVPPPDIFKESPGVISNLCSWASGYVPSYSALNRVAGIGISILNDVVFPVQRNKDDLKLELEKQKKRLEDKDKDGIIVDLCQTLANTATDRVKSTTLLNKGQLEELIVKNLGNCEFISPYSPIFYHSLGLQKSSIATAEKSVINIFAKVLDSVVLYLADNSKESIATNVEANLLKIFANLLESSTCEPNKDKNPLERVLSLFAECLNNHLPRAEEIEKSNKSTKEKEALQLKIFQELTDDILLIAFPKGAQEIICKITCGKAKQSVIPGVSYGAIDLPVEGIAQEGIWWGINKHLPQLFFDFYKEVREPLSEIDPDWQQKFNDFVGVKDAHEVAELPKKVIQEWIAEPKNVEKIQQYIKQNFADPNYPAEKAEKISVKLTKWLMDLLKTDDEFLQNSGSLVQRYFAEKLIWNIYQKNGGPEGKKLASSVLGKINGCFNKLTSPDHCDEVVGEVLEIAGLNKKETFPLPPMIKNSVTVWTKIVETETKLVKDQILPIVHDGEAKNKLEALTQGDKGVTNLVSSLLAMIPFAVEPLVRKAIDSIEGLSQEQKTMMSNQIFQAVHNEGLVKSYLDSIAFQLMYRLYERYLQAHPNRDFPFIPWVSSQLRTVVSPIALSMLTQQETGKLAQLNKLKDSEENPQLVNSLWNEFEPKFNLISSQLLQLVGVTVANDLPVPKGVQDVSWKHAQKGLSWLLFKAGGDALQPILERETNKQIIRQNLSSQAADLTIRACDAMTKDVIDGIPYWFQNYQNIAQKINHDHLQKTLTAADEKDLGERIKQLVETKTLKAKTLLEIIDSYYHPGKPAPYTQGQRGRLLETLHDYKQEIKGVLYTTEEISKDLVPQFWQNITDKELTGFIRKEHDPYNPVWSFLESHIEGMFLKIAAELSKRDSEHSRRLRERVAQTKEALNGKTPEAAKLILENFATEIMAMNGIRTSADLYGIPLPFQTLLYDLFVKVLSKKLVGTHSALLQFDATPANPHAIMPHLPPTLLAEATSVILGEGIKYGISKMEGQLWSGNLPDQIYNGLDPQLESLRQNGVRTAGIIQELNRSGMITPYINNTANQIISNPGSLEYLATFKEIVHPILFDKLSEMIAPILERERREGAGFDLQLLDALLPILLRHVRNLSEASGSEGRLTRQHLESLALSGPDHPAPLPGREEFYDITNKKFVKALFPNGKVEFTASLPVGARHQAEPLWRLTKSSMRSYLPELLPYLFNRDTIILILTKLFEKARSILSSPIDLTPAPAPTEAEKNLDKLVGQLVKEGALLMKLPVNGLDKLPVWIQKLIGWKNLKESSFESVGRSLRQIFGGSFLLETINEALLPTLRQHQFEVITPFVREQRHHIAVINLKKAEHDLISCVIGFVIRYVGAKTKHSLERFDNKGKFIRAIKNGVVLVCSFVALKVIGGILGFSLKVGSYTMPSLKTRIERRIYNWVDNSAVKTIDIFSNGDLHENTIFRSLNSIEQVLRT